MITARMFAGSLLLVVVFLSTPFADAQLTLTGLERPLSLSISPQYPAAGDTIRLSLQSYALDLDRSSVVWYANGKEIAKGNGMVSTSVTAGTLGSEIVLDVVAEEESGLVGSAHAEIRPTEVDLLWETDSYVPPFYKGRALAGTSANIRAQAIARFKKTNGTMVPDTDIIFSWYKGATRFASGRGKSMVSFIGPTLFSEDRISVVAESADTTLKGSAQARIVAVDPSAELYENHPLFGVLYHRALVGSVATLENEQKVTAVPYFAHVLSPRDPGLSYEWHVNNSVIAPNPESPDDLIITANGYIGPATIGLSLTSATDWFLRAIGNWTIEFGGNTNGIFGNNPFGAPLNQ